MKKYNHPIDDLFREALEDHQIKPSDAARAAFLKEAGEIPRKNNNGSKPLILSVLLLALLGAGLLIWAVSTDKFTTGTIIKASDNDHKVIASTIKPDNKTTTPQQAKTVKSSGNDDGQTRQTSAQPAPAIKHEPQKSAPLSSSGNQSGTHPLKHTSTATNPGITGKTTLPVQSQQVNSQESHTPVNNKSMPDPAVASAPGMADATVQPGLVSAGTEEKTAVAPIPGQEPAPDMETAVNQLNQPDTTKPAPKADSTITPQAPVNEKVKEHYRKQHALIPSIGIYYAPEWMFNTLEGSKFVNNFGVEGTFRFGSFSVRTGAGLSIAKGTNELIVAYNEFLGAYSKLDSMSFTWNNPTQQYIPKYFMSSQSVWDSLMRLDHAKVVKRYTYLQIPLIMGYDFWEGERISMGVRMGPVMSVLLATKQLSAEYDAGKNRIVSINDIAPGQVSLNWQVMAGLNTSFLLTKELRFEVEPWVKYYFNSVYEKPVNNAKPWSVGVRMAFGIRL
jgi:hypothetical protein